MDKFDDFLDSIRYSVKVSGGSDMLNDFIAFLGFNDSVIVYKHMDCCSAEVIVGDLTVLLSVDLMYNKGYFTVYDNTDYTIKDTAYFKFDGGKWIEAD
jgi:hypothetical protein